MGELPAWYICLRAARYLNVAPWDLAEQPLIWSRWALAAESAAQKTAQEQAQREQRRKK